MIVRRRSRVNIHVLVLPLILVAFECGSCNTANTPIQMASNRSKRSLSANQICIDGDRRGFLKNGRWSFETDIRNEMNCLIPISLVAAMLAAGNRLSGGEISFNRDIRPILSEHCFDCHGPD